MAPQKSPAFQFYAKDFLAGTATMSLAERGAYVTLLAHQWDAGAVPSGAKERARILGCTASEERRIWATLVSKFVYADDVFKNTRLEEERSKQAEYRRRQSDKGKASAATRRQPESNRGSTVVESRLQPEGQPESNSSSATASSSSGKDQKQQQQTRGGALIKSPEYYARRMEHCAFVGAKLEIPNGLHADLRRTHGGPDPEKELQDWYLTLDEAAELEAWRIPDGRGIFPWLKELHAKAFPVAAVNGAKTVMDEIDEWAKS